MFDIFEYDYCFCGNPEKCPHKNECKRAKKIKGIHTYSYFYNKGEKCNYFLKDENDENKI